MYIDALVSWTEYVCPVPGPPLTTNGWPALGAPAA
jgi:hypothetical protein